MSIFMKKYHRENPEKFYRNIESRKLVSEKLAGENNGMYNKKHSEESKRKMSESRKNSIQILKDGIKISVKVKDINRYFCDGWIMNQKKVLELNLDNSYINNEKYLIEFEKWKNSSKRSGKSRLDQKQKNKLNILT